MRGLWPLAAAAAVMVVVGAAPSDMRGGAYEAADTGIVADGWAVHGPTSPGFLVHDAIRIWGALAGPWPRAMESTTEDDYEAGDIGIVADGWAVHRPTGSAAPADDGLRTSLALDVHWPDAVGSTTEDDAVQADAVQPPVSPEQAIRLVFGQQAEVAIGIAMCESTMNPNAVGSLGERGLFQVHPIHRAYLERHGIGWADMFDPLVNARAAYLLSQGGTSWAAWRCGG